MKVIQYIKLSFTRQPAFWLVLSLGLLLLAPLPMAAIPEYKRGVLGFIFSLVILSGICVMYKSFQRVILGILLGLSANILILISMVRETHFWLNLSRSACILLFTALIGKYLFKLVYKSKVVTKNVIYASVAGYLLIGILGGQACLLLEILFPGSFSHTGLYKFYDFQYFSFVTLTTLGYGDIIPINPPAKAITLLISLKGQLYLTVIIALLIGKYTSQKLS